MRKPDQTQGTESTTLHLGKIISHPGGDTPTTTLGEESGTIIIKKAAAQVAQQSPESVVLPKGATALAPKEMLGTMAYAYAKGVYRSEDIEEKMLQDAGLRDTLSGEVPDARALRRFRYLNRAAIQATLEKFYFWKRKQKMAASAGESRPAGPGSTGVRADENSTVCVKREAAEKLDEAACVDNMLKDE
jgi:hypothetical protein